MNKKMLLLKSATALMATTLVVGALSYSSEPYEPKTLNLNALSLATQNIQHIAQRTPASAAVVNAETSNDRIVKVIENELENKINSNQRVIASENSKWKQKAKNWEKETAKHIALVNEAGDVEISANATVINNDDLIKLYAMETEESISYNTFDNVVAEISWPKENEVVTTDEVSVALSSQDKNQDVDNGDDLVMFDYSKDEAIVDSVSTQSTPKQEVKFSSSVQEAIKREMGKVNTHKVSDTPKASALAFSLPKAQKVEATKDAMDAFITEDSVVYDYRNPSAKPSKKEIADEMSKAVASFASVTKNTTILKAKEINLNQKNTTSLEQFEFVPDYERADRISDGGSGEITFDYNLTGEMNTQTGVVQKQGLIPTRVELDLNKNEWEIPLFNEESIQKFLKKEKISIEGNLILARMADEVMDVELDTGYQAKLFLDDNFKVVADASVAEYAFFLGTKTGNTSLRYLLSNKESAEKIVYVGEGEMFFDDSTFMNTQRELYTLTTRNILGKTVRELNIQPEFIKYFGTTNTAKKKTLNSYELKVPNRVENTRKYLELSHLGYSLYIGHGEKTEIEVPANDFVNTVLDAHGIKDLSQRCMVQINLSKELNSVKVNGKNTSGEMFTEVSYLDKEGNFSADNSELAEKIFILGDQEGQVSSKLEYSDGSVEFVKSYCTNGAYFIEQL